MDFKTLLSQLDQKYAALEAENLALKQQLAAQTKQYEHMLVQNKKAFKVQHKKYILKYEEKIKQLKRRPLGKKPENEMNQSVRAFSPNFKSPTKKLEPIEPIELLERELARELARELEPLARELEPLVRERERALGAVPKEFIENGDDDFIPTQYSSDDSLPSLDNKTPLHQRQKLNEYYIKKFQDPEFKIDLTTNPITRTKWLVSDFKSVQTIDDTPPFFFFKDNTSQEDQIKQEYYENNQRQMVTKCLRDTLAGENQFGYDILNAYVNANRYYQLQQ